MSDGKRVYLYFPESDMPAYEALRQMCPPSVPLATFLRSVLVRHAFGKQHERQHYGNSEHEQRAPEGNERSFLAGIDGMLVDDESESNT